ncbi:hypothetical protein ACLOJK_026661 [Asimina triloba]
MPLKEMEVASPPRAADFGGPMLSIACCCQVARDEVVLCCPNLEMEDGFDDWSDLGGFLNDPPFAVVFVDFVGYWPLICRGEMEATPMACPCWRMGCQTELGCRIGIGSADLLPRDGGVPLLIRFERFGRLLDVAEIGYGEGDDGLQGATAVVHHARSSPDKGDEGDAEFTLLLPTMGAASLLLRWEEDRFLGLPLSELVGKMRSEMGCRRDRSVVVPSTVGGVAGDGFAGSYDEDDDPLIGRSKRLRQICDCGSIAVILLGSDRPSAFYRKNRRTAAMAAALDEGDGAPNRCSDGAL